MRMDNEKKTKKIERVAIFGDKSSLCSQDCRMKEPEWTRMLPGVVIWVVVVDLRLDQVDSSS